MDGAGAIGQRLQTTGEAASGGGSGPVIVAGSKRKTREKAKPQRIECTSESTSIFEVISPPDTSLFPPNFPLLLRPENMQAAPAASVTEFDSLIVRICSNLQQIVTNINTLYPLAHQQREWTLADMRLLSSHAHSSDSILHQRVDQFYQTHIKLLGTSDCEFYIRHAKKLSEVIQILAENKEPVVVPEIIKRATTCLSCFNTDSREYFAFLNKIQLYVNKTFISLGLQISGEMHRERIVSVNKIAECKKNDTEHQEKFRNLQTELTVHTTRMDIPEEQGLIEQLSLIIISHRAACASLSLQTPSTPTSQ